MIYIFQVVLRPNNMVLFMINDSHGVLIYMKEDYPLTIGNAYFTIYCPSLQNSVLTSNKISTNFSNLYIMAIWYTNLRSAKKSNLSKI